jgi:hypothetical protein
LSSGSTRRKRWRTLVVPCTTEEVVTHSGDIDVHVLTRSFAAGLAGACNGPRCPAGEFASGMPLHWWGRWC